MKLKACFFWVAIAATMFLATANAAGPRYGNVVSLEPIENRGEDESATTKTKRKIGRTLGGLAGAGILGSGKGGTTGLLVADSADEAGEAMATKIGDQGPTTRYMVKLRLDSGKVMSITQLRQQIDGIQVGSRVRVEGSGDSALIYAE